MKDKHIKIDKDSALHKLIKSEVKEKLIINTPETRRKIWLKFIVYILLMSISYFMLFQIKSVFLFIVSYVIYGLASLLFAFNFSHDLSHNTVFKSQRLNNIFYILTYTIVGAHAEAWKKRHVNSHHYAPNVEGYDSDLKITKLIRVTPSSEYLWFHKFQHIYAPIAYTSYSLFWVFIKDFVILLSKDDCVKQKSYKYYLSFCAQKIVYIVLTLIFPIWFSGQPWTIVLSGFILMHLTLSFFLLFTFFMTHHVESTQYPTTDNKGFINTSWLMNQIKSSNDMHPFSETANFILGGFNNHIAHHLFPHVHHLHYPKLNKILYALLKDNGVVPNQTSYIGGMVSHLKYLKQMGKQ